MGQNKLELPPQITIGKLNNGLSYYIVPENSKGKVRITLLSNTGAFAEAPEEHGYAHVLEHMMFNGSKNFPGAASSSVLEDMGMRQGKEYTANTSSLSTQYDLFIPENNLDYLHKCLLLYKDWICDLELNKTSLDSEKKVVIEELKLGGGGTGASPFLIGTEMEEHDVIGDQKAINSVNIEKLREFYKKFYTPDQLAIIISGVIDKNKAIQMIKEVFTQVPSSPLKVTNKYPNLTQETIVNGGYNFKDLSKKTNLTIVSKRKAFVIDSYTNLKQSYINRIFSDMLKHRFEQDSGNRISDSDVNIVDPIPGNQLTNIRLKSSQNVSYKQMLDDFCIVLAQVKQYGFLVSEINYYANNILIRAEKQKEMASLTFSTAQNSFLSGGNTPLTGQENYKYAKQIIKELSPKDFEQVVDNFISDHKTILFDNTSKAFSSDFTREYILQKLNEIHQLKVSPYEFKEPRMTTKEQTIPAIETLTIANKTPAKLEKRIAIAENLTLLKYKNGIQVILNNTPGELTIIKTFSKDGLNTIPKIDRDFFKNAVNYVDGGYGNHTAKDISDFEMSLGVNRRSTVSNESYEYKVSGSPKNFDQIIKIFHLSTTEAYKQDEALFKRKSKPYLTEKPKIENDSILINNANAASLPAIKKDTINIAAATERFFNYNQNLKKNLSSSLVYISGALPTNVEDLVSKYIATIPTSVIKPIKTEFKKPTTFSGISKEEIIWKSKGCKVIHLFNHIPNKQPTFKDELILEAIAQFSNIKMLQIIREKYGLVYSTGTTGTTKTEPHPFYELSVRYMIDPLNIDLSCKILNEEVLTPISKGQITDKEVEQLKSMLTTTYITSFFDDKQIEEEWILKNIKYRTILTPALITETINSISSDDIKNMMQEIVDIKNYRISILKQEKKAI